MKRCLTCFTLLKKITIQQLARTSVFMARSRRRLVIDTSHLKYRPIMFDNNLVLYGIRSDIQCRQILRIRQTDGLIRTLYPVTEVGDIPIKTFGIRRSDYVELEQEPSEAVEKKECDLPEVRQEPSEKVEKKECDLPEVRQEPSEKVEKK